VSAHRETTGGTDERLAALYARRLANSLGLMRFAGNRILDFGAGSGYFAQQLSDLGARVTCVDRFAYEKLRQAGLDAYRSESDIPADRHFEGIVMVDVLEHLPDPWHALASLRSLLAAGGWLFAATPNFSGLSALALGEKWAQVRNPAHLVCFTPETVRRALRESGFRTTRRLHWKIPYSNRIQTRALHWTLEVLGLAGELRFLART
jgi:2-polyprenyl-3-methyl-5-hydroxy-6-metoxy-1,4-benzoquinol methylase